MSRARLESCIAAAFLLALPAAFLACGGGGDNTNAPNVAVASVALSTTSTDAMVSLGESRSVTAVAKDAGGATVSSPALSWSSSAPGVATVSGSGASATVTAVGNGTATITAASGSVQGTVTFAVAQRATGVGLTGAPASLVPGATAQLKAEARDAKSRGVAGVSGFTYASSDQSIAVVNASGIVTAISPGVATISSNVTVSGTALSGSTTVGVAFATTNPTSAAVDANDANIFSPPTVTIGTGGTVTWSFASTQHNVTFGSNAGAPPNIGSTATAQVARTFTTPGTFEYDCTLHAGMHGAVVVQGSGVAPNYIAILNGANEKPSAVTTSGAGAASFTISGTTVSYVVTFSRLTGVPIMSHIHAPGNATQTAAVLVDFPVTGQTATNGVLRGTFTASDIRNAGISIDSLFKLMRTGDAYVNVHTAQFPAGEIRGQTTVP